MYDENVLYHHIRKTHMWGVVLVLVALGLTLLIAVLVMTYADARTGDVQAIVTVDHTPPPVVDANKPANRLRFTATRLNGTYRLLRRSARDGTTVPVDRCDNGTSAATLRSGIQKGRPVPLVYPDYVAGGSGDGADVWEIAPNESCADASAVYIANGDVVSGQYLLTYSLLPGNDEVTLARGADTEHSTCWFVERYGQTNYVRLMARRGNGSASYLRWDPFCGEKVSLDSADTPEWSQLEWYAESTL